MVERQRYNRLSGSRKRDRDQCRHPVRDRVLSGGHPVGHQSPKIATSKQRCIRLVSADRGSMTETAAVPGFLLAAEQSDVPLVLWGSGDEKKHAPESTSPRKDQDHEERSSFGMRCYLDCHGHIGGVS
jgi:hypothetical protein